jgi:hypothetical protein
MTYARAVIILHLYLLEQCLNSVLRTSIKTCNFVTFCKFLNHLGVHHTHNNTKQQHQKLSYQLLDRVQEFVWKSRDLLSEPGHGIPSVAEINKNGRRQQDKAESTKMVSLTREKITVDMVTKLACTTSLSDDKVLRLGDD